MGDTVLSNMRAIIKSSHEGFPSEALADKIRFTEEDIDYILATRYGQKQVFLVLSLLYPWVDYRNAFHLDHIHPQTMFSGKKLKQAHLPEQDIEFCLAHYDELPNLQILANIPNIEKSNQPFDKWLADTYKGKKYRAGTASSQRRSAWRLRFFFTDNITKPTSSSQPLRAPIAATGPKARNAFP
ncbi:MAG: hypothetical protein DMG96_16945 [Acidobacteria bacterium]|nr:MAG: hypothetical protein DMG96_16945 [Acidobacteriota bacterium]